MNFDWFPFFKSQSDVIQINEDNEALIDIRAAREKAGKTQKELAELLGISQSQLSRYEQSPGDAPQRLVAKLQKVLGLPGQPSQIIGIDPGDPYKKMYSSLSFLEQYILRKDPELDLSNFPIPPSGPKELKELVRQYKQKPNVVLTGSFDTGKSHLANSLLGEKYLPAKYTPATKVITFIRHIDDRPEWMKEDVWIFGEDFWRNQKDDKQDEYIINIEFLNDQERCEKNRLQAGTLDALQQYGVHGGRDTEIAAHTAVAYLNSPILRACNLIDLPGYSDVPDEISLDTQKATRATQIADIIIYTSMAKGYINGQDISRISNLIRMLPTPEGNSPDFPSLGNLFIVATHADPNIKDTDLEEILEKGSIRLFKNLSQTLDRRSQETHRRYTQEVLRQRFFSFWSETPSRYEALFTDLTDVLEKHLPLFYEYRFNEDIGSLKRTGQEKLSQAINEYEKTIQEQDFARKQYEELMARENERKKNALNRKEMMIKFIHLVKTDSIQSFNRNAERFLSASNMESIIKERFSKKDDAKNGAAEYILERLKIITEENLEKNSKRIIPEIKRYIEEYENPIKNLEQSKVGSVSIPFEAGKAFLAGLSGVGSLSIGALSGLVITVGSIGGQVVASAAVGLLSAIGIKLTAGVTSALALAGIIGGPIILGTALVAGVTLSTWSLLADSWQSRLAKKLKKVFDDGQVISELEKCIDDYWNDTEAAFLKGADSIEKAWQRYLKHQEEITSPGSKAKVENLIEDLQKLYDFFAGIPA